MPRRTPPDSWRELLRAPNPWVPPEPLPGPVETERIVIRRYETADAAALFEAIESSREALHPYMAWAVTDHQTEADSGYYIEQQRREAEKPDCTNYGMGLFDRRTGRFVGGTGFHRIDVGVQDVEVGYWIRADVRGRGLCTEATGGLISSALRPQAEGGWGFRRARLFCDVQNVGSWRVTEKLGLRLEQRTKKDRYLGTLVDGEPVGYVDSFGYAVLADEWDFDTHRARPGIAWEGGRL